MHWRLQECRYARPNISRLSGALDRFMLSDDVSIASLGSHGACASLQTGMYGIQRLGSVSLGRRAQLRSNAHMVCCVQCGLWLAKPQKYYAAQYRKRTLIYRNPGMLGGIHRSSGTHDPGSKLKIQTAKQAFCTHTCNLLHLRDEGCAPNLLMCRLYVVACGQSEQSAD